MAQREVLLPWTNQPQESARVRSELNPIGGIQPGGFGFSDTAGLPLTFNGAYVSEALNEQGRTLAFLDNNSTGLTRSVSVSTWPLTFVFSGSVSGTSFRALSSLATTGDKTVRVYGLDGIVTLQRIGNTTSANAGVTVWNYGKPFTCVCVVRSDSDASVYALGSVGYAEAHSTANVGTMPTLNKLAFGKYSGSVDLYPQYGQTNIAQWLAIDPTRQQIDEWLRNPWQLFAPQSIWVPVSAGGGPSTQNLLPSSIASLEAFGTASISVGAVTVAVSSIASSEEFGTHVISNGSLILVPTGISSAEAFGAASLQAGTIIVTPSGIASAEAFGTGAVLVGELVIYPNGISSAELFGIPTLTGGTPSTATSVFYVRGFSSFGFRRNN